MEKERPKDSQGVIFFLGVCHGWGSSRSSRERMAKLAPGLLPVIKETATRRHNWLWAYSWLATQMHFYTVLFSRRRSQARSPVSGGLNTWKMSKTDLSVPPSLKVIPWRRTTLSASIVSICQMTIGISRKSLSCSTVVNEANHWATTGP